MHWGSQGGCIGWRWREPIVTITRKQSCIRASSCIYSCNISKFKLFKFIIDKTRWWWDVVRFRCMKITRVMTDNQKLFNVVVNCANPKPTKFWSNGPADSHLTISCDINEFMQSARKLSSLLFIQLTTQQPLSFRQGHRRFSSLSDLCELWRYGGYWNWCFCLTPQNIILIVVKMFI